MLVKADRDGADQVPVAPPPRMWLRFVARRLGRLLVSLLVVASAAWAMIHAVPGNPVRAALGMSAPQSLVNEERHALGLDRPIGDQYLSFLHGIVTGHLGFSLSTNLSVWSEIARFLPATLELAGLAFLVTIVLAVILGVIAGAATQNDRHAGAEIGFSAITGLFASIPNFLLGVGGVALFAVTLHALPVSGRGGLDTYILPVGALAVGPTAILLRVVRVETVRVLREDYIRTARAKRLPTWMLYFRHALPNLLTATLTVGGLILVALIAGTVLVENVFAWPGMGMALVQAIETKDYPMVQGFALVYGALVLVINLVVDLLIAAIDPRSRIGEL